MTPPDFPRLDELAPGSVAIVFGTRPEIIKLSGIIDVLEERACTVFSGQHFDPLLSDIFFDALQLAPPDVMLAVGGRSRAQQIGELVLGLEELFADRRPAVVVVQGDTNTALGGALAANALAIPLVHVEAGLRSYDRRMPEEHNRVAVDHLSDLCLAPTELARKNLLGEGIPGARIVVTGNTVVDVAIRLLPPPGARAALLDEMGLQAGSFVLATFHRPENVDDATRLRTLLGHLEGLGLPVLFPMHPRTRRRVEAFELDGKLDRVEFVDPISYPNFLGLAAECAFLVSDSGGVQEEASVVKRPALILRRSSDRPEVLGTFTALVHTISELPGLASEILEDLEERHQRLARMPTPYGDGFASVRCAQQIVSVARSAPARSGGAPRSEGPPSNDATDA